MKKKEVLEKNKKRIQTISSFLKECRISAGYTQQELSSFSHVSRNSIIRFESCNPANVTILTIFEIADALELDINQIFIEVK